MPTLFRVRCTWTGLTSGAGVSTFYYLTTLASGDITALKAFWTAAATCLPNSVTVRTPNTGDLLDAASGGLTGTWTTGSAGTATGSYSDRYAAGVGGGVNWLTGTVVGRRRLRGKTYIVPMLQNCYATDGTLDNTVLAGLASAAATLVSASPSLAVWHRPLHAAGGQAVAVTASSVDDRVRTLRTRR